jgi:hypothetical protein
MKKIIASAVGLMLAGGIAATAASAAVENQFGGYWRNRMYYQDQFKQDDQDTWTIDQRTRLFYTAKFNDDFKFVNKFEFNSTWGDNDGGDIGADATDIWRVKNSYADFNVGPVNAKLGIQAATVARGFIFDDDFSGAMVTGKFGNVSVPLVYISSSNEDLGAKAHIADTNEDIFAALASVKISDAMSVTPYFVYHTISGEETDNWYIGVDADMKFSSISIWGTGIYNGGTVDDADTQAFLAAVGVDAGIAHGQAFYATGDDNAADGDNDAFVSAPGSSYYWSEILGMGVFDNKTTTTSKGDDITNVMAANGGVTIKPMDKLKIDADVWYAALAEDNAKGDTELGVEFDGKLTYTIMDSLLLKQSLHTSSPATLPVTRMSWKAVYVSPSSSNSGTFTI